MRLDQVTLPADDIERSAAFHPTLGFRPIVVADHDRRFQAPDGDATLSIHRGGVAGDACIYLQSDRPDDEVARLSAAGIVFDGPPVDRSWLWREAWPRDPAGDRVRLHHAGRNRLDPPWRVTT